MKMVGIILMMIMDLFAFKSIYIWSKEFNIEDNNKIISFLKNHKIKNALVSASENTDFNKLKQFISLAKENNIKVEFLIGDNRWIYPEKRIKINNKLFFLKKFNNPYIHLDIEPHTISELKHNREKYLQMYLEMLRYIKKQFPNYHISISIPTFYAIDYVKQFSEYVDKIYLMAYEYKNLAQLKRRIERYKSLKQKIVIAFNCKEFTKDSLEEGIQFVYSLGYKNIAFHSFKTLKVLDEVK